jgi:deoxyribonuclease-4
MFLGAHESISGGLHKAIERIASINGTALQIFSRNQRQWKSRVISADESVLFQQAWKAWGDFPIAVHGSYLINLASAKEETRQKSIRALAEELQRTAGLGIAYVVLHPGSHGKAGVETGIVKICKGLDEAYLLSGLGDKAPMVLLETIAGQGTGIGAAFEELAAIIDGCKCKDKLGVCLDTCHIFAAGYDFRMPETFQTTFQQFAAIIGLERLKFMHINDSKKGLGSRVDRHEHIGQGEIGLEGFRQIMTADFLSNIPMTLETPKGDDLQEDVENMRVLQSLAISV